MSFKFKTFVAAKDERKFEHLLYTLYLYNVIMSYVVGQNEPIDSETDLDDLRFGISFDVRANKRLLLLFLILKTTIYVLFHDKLCATNCPRSAFNS
jgi:hypothetical protein